MKIDSKTPAKPGKDTIYIDVDDEITSIIDKVENAKEKVVALVLPKRSTALQSIVNMRLLKRSSENANKNVVLITAESALLPLAGAVSIHVAKNLQTKPEIPPAPRLAEEESKTEELTQDSSPELEDEDLPIKINYDQPIGDLADELEEEKDIVELQDEATAEVKESKLSKIPGGSKIKVPNFDKFRISLGLGLIAIIGLIVFIYLAVSVLPKATISIQTISTPVTANFTMTTSDQAKTVDLKGNIIPAVLKTSDQTLTQQVQTTGQLNNGDKAKGSVTMTAGDCSGTVPSDVPAGSGITSAGLTFITQQSLTFSPVVSGGKCTFQSTSASDIVAISGGTKFNIGPATFTVANRSGVTANSSKATSGGTDNIQPTVSQADLDGAKAKVSTTSSDAFGKTFQAQLGEQGFYVLASTFRQGDPQTSASPAVGQPGATATVTVKITFSVLVVKKDDLKAAINNALASQIDKTKQKVEDSDLLAGATVSLSNQTSDTAATLNITEDTKAVPVLDSNSVKNQVKGLKKGDIQIIIGNITGVKAVDVKYSPFWVSKVPKNVNKIKVVITHVAGSSSGQ